MDNRPVNQARIAFIATREPEYSRVSIVRRQLQRYFEVDEYLSGQSRYPLRLIAIACQLILAWLTGRLKKNDAVFVGFFAQPIFPLVRLLYRGPIIADAYFSLFDTMVNDKRKARQDSLVGKLCFWLDRHMLLNAQMCFTDTSEHVDYLREAFGAGQADVRRLWISAESQPLESAAAAATESQPFEVLFWGGFIPLQGVETIVEAAARLNSENVNVTMIGAGQTLAKCLELRARLEATNVEFPGWGTPESIARQAARCHVALGIFGTTEKAARVIPNKAYEALAMGIPLITRSSPAADELLHDGVDCLLVEPGDAAALAAKILHARDDFEEARQIANAGRQLFDDVCSPDKVGEILHRDIQSILSPDLQSASSATPTSVPSV